jgi:Zn-dependent metalloprotease
MGSVLLVAVLAASASSAAASPLERKPGVSVDRSAETGALRAIATDPGATVPAPASLPEGAGARRTALAFADSYGPRFGVAGGAGELEVIAVQPRIAGGKTVRLQQEIAGVPVIGGELQINLDDSGDLRSMTGEGEPDAPASVEPRISAEEAAATALAAVAKARGIDPAGLQAAAPQLAILDPRIMGGPPSGPEGPRLVWQLEVQNDGAVQTIRDFVAVDATAGVVAVQFPQIEKALDRVVCDANSVPSAGVPCEAPYARTEGSPATGDADVDLAYDYAGDTYDLYKGLGRDSLDGEGMQLRSTVKFCPEPSVAPDPPNCPYKNAFWNGEQMVYGAGFAAADDVVGHELTHGFTEFTSHLFYYYQSGAINESLSDVFGELVDLTNGAGDDTAADRWLMGEDLPVDFNRCGSNPHAIRNMANPPECGDPDTTSSSYYKFDPNGDLSAGDSGGVHSNSGVNNKAAALMVDGGDFNGQRITGIGIPKVERLYFRVDSALLGSASNYQDLAGALRQACSDFVTAGTGGFTGDDCAQVDKALLAVKMDTPPAVAPATTRLPACTDPADTTPALYSEDFEDEDAVEENWVAQEPAAGSPAWFYPPEANPVGLDATYATSGTENLWGFDQEGISEATVEMQQDVDIPFADGRLRFNHAYSFDAFDGEYYDGGLLEYSTDGGASWQDAAPLLRANGYTGAISSEYENPLAGRTMWSGESGGYRKVLVNLTPLAGQSVRFRFRLATDNSVADYGWFIDDFEIYRCANHVPPETELKRPPRERIVTAGPTATMKARLRGDDDTTPSIKLTYECRVDDGEWEPCAKRPRFEVGSRAGKGEKHVLRARAVDRSGNHDPTPIKAVARAVQTPPG